MEGARLSRNLDFATSTSSQESIVHSPNLITPIVAEQVINGHRASAARSRLAPRLRRIRGRRSAALSASVPRGRPTFPSAVR